ncbi:MAG: hypothetical protein ABSB75_05710 [Candidatus Limnocylindrales bacterium]
MQTVRAHRGRSGLGRAKGLAIVAACATLLAGCVMGGCSAPPAPSLGTAAPSPVASAAWTPTPIPSVGGVPAGPWTGIKWINAGSVFPRKSTGGADLAPYPTVYGWSHGFVGFTATTEGDTSGAQQDVTLIGVASPDGLHWTVGHALDAQGLQYAAIMSVVEGPAGLVAVGRGPGAICGGPPTVNALWTSTDGLTWSRVTLPPDFAAASVYTVDGGTTGYIAAGTLKDGTTQVVWLSSDGSSWRQVTLASSTFGEFVVAGGVNFGGGYVVSGAVRNDAGCGETMVTPSLWWSTDGGSWTRATLAGAAPVTEAWLTMTKISDHALMAYAEEWNETTQASSQHVWVSNDGRTWKLVGSPSKMLSPGIFSNRQRGLSVLDPIVVTPSEPYGPLAIGTVGDDLSVTALSQIGDGPAVSEASTAWSAALGPTGLVVLSLDGTALWLGVPTAS